MKKFLDVWGAAIDVAIFVVAGAFAMAALVFLPFYLGYAFPVFG